MVWRWTPKALDQAANLQALERAAGAGLEDSIPINAPGHCALGISGQAHVLSFSENVL
jgi:hypothetical protein